MGPPVQTNWYSICGSAESIVGICVRSRREGMTFGESMHPISLPWGGATDIFNAAGDTDTTVRATNQNSGVLLESVA